jgi:hypothetical protein
MKKIVLAVLFGSALVGGNANNGSNCGPFYVNSSNAPSNRNANIGSRLYFIFYKKQRPCLLAKNKTQKGVGR